MKLIQHVQGQLARLGLIPGGGAGGMKAQAVRASAWTMGGYAFSQVVRLGSNVLLAWLLASPEAFGLMILIQTLMQGLAMFSDIGLGPSIVRDKDGDNPLFLNTAWTVQIVRGLVLAAVAMALATPYAMFYGQPALVVLVMVAAISPAISAFNSTKLFTHSRRLDVRLPTLIQLTSQTVSSAVMIGWAFVSPTVWALLVGGLVGACIRMTLSHLLLHGVSNRPAWDPAMRRRLFNFGRWIMVATILTFLANQGDRLLFGKLLTLEELGIYAIAVMMAGVATELVLQLGTAVVFPVYSAMLNQGREIRPMFSRVREPLMLGAGFVVTCLVAGGEPLIRVLYSGHFEEAGWMLEILAVGGWFQVMAVSTGSALLAMGHSKATAMGNLSKLAGMSVLVPTGWYLGGLEGAIVGLVLSDAAKYAALGVVARQRGLNGFAQEAALTVVLLGGCVVNVLVAERLTAIGWPDVATGAVVGVVAAVWWGAVAAVRLRRGGVPGVSGSVAEAA